MNSSIYRRTEAEPLSCINIIDRRYLCVNTSSCSEIHKHTDSLHIITWEPFIIIFSSLYFQLANFYICNPNCLPGEELIFLSAALKWQGNFSLWTQLQGYYWSSFGAANGGTDRVWLWWVPCIFQNTNMVLLFLGHGPAHSNAALKRWRKGNLPQHLFHLAA